MAMRRTRRDAPWEDEDERVATLRALRRMRDMATEHPRELERERRRTAVATPVESDEEEVEEEEYDHVYTSVAKATTNGTKPRGSVSFVDDTQRAAVESGGVEPSQHRRNRLETRLEELQRDVASLTMRLRESGTPSHSHKTYRENDEAERVPSRSIRRHRDGETVKSVVHETPPQRKESRATTPKAAVWRSEGHPVESTPSPSDQTVRRRKRGHQNTDTSTTGSTGGGRGTRDATRALRDLQVIAVERDQLRYELEQVKKALNSMDKKCQDALKWKEAYVKMKTHCESLQESLELSEKIRIRQKKLLLQQQKQQMTAPPPNGTMNGTASKPSAIRKSSRYTTDPTSAQQQVDIIASVLQDSSPEMDQPRPRQRSTVDPPTARTRSRPTPSVRDANRSINQSVRSIARSEFDSFLQQPPGRLPMKNIDHSVVSSLLSQKANRKRVSAVTRGADRSMSRPQDTSRSAASRVSRRPTPSAVRTSNFLAPTQASLRQITPRKADTQRRPFVC